MRFLFGNCVLDATRRELRRDDELLAVEPQVFDLLLYLIENRERVVSKDDMLAAVWGGRIVSESTLTSRISAARKAIGDVGGERRLIRTIARKGLRFVGAVTTTAPAEPQHDDRAVSAPPHPAIPNNLPQRGASFFGREQDVADVGARLTTTSLVTLIGAGGIGKTALALKIAAGILDRFPDGVWLVELAPVADPKLVASTVADALGVLEEPGRPLLSTLLNFLRPRRLLILLDNCEHLIEACARFADAVLRVSGEARILATSREPLGIAGELVWRVLSLPTPSPHEAVTVSDLVRYPSVRLFAERANFARASFRVTDDNASSVSRICRQLDGIPLAIELAASRVKAMQVEQIVERLGDRFRLLTGGSRTAAPHQQTLRSTIDWSYGLLSDAERLLLCRLSVFSGGWTLEAAESVCAQEGESFDVLDTLTLLADKSLIALDERAPEPRYRMLETIRQYGNEKLAESGALAASSDRHLQYYTRVAEFLEPHFFHPDQAKWYAKADSELDNSRVALEWALRTRNFVCGLRLVNALHRYWVARVYWMEAADWLRRLLALAGASSPTPLHAKALFIAGHISNYYDPVAAERLGAESLLMSRLLDYRQGIVNALWLLGWCAIPRLDGSAAPYFEESIALAREIDHVFGAVHGYAWYGVYQAGIGEYEAAKPLLEAGKVQARRLGDDITLLGRCDGNLGLIALLQGDYAAAKDYLDNSLKLVTEAGNKNGTAEALWLHGRLALRQQDYLRAIDYFVESLTLYRFYSDSLWVTRGLAYLTITYLACGKPDLAAHLAGALDGGEGGSARLKHHLGSLAAISEYEQAISRLRAMLVGADFDAAYDAGRKMSREQAIEYALQHRPQPARRSLA